jgi:hypothetical protein
LWYNASGFPLVPESPDVPEFSPFAGVRYDCEAAHADLGALVAPPYDVVDDDQRDALEAADEHNSVRLILPRDVAREGDRYAHAAETFVSWRTAGVLVADTAPPLCLPDDVRRCTGPSARPGCARARRSHARRRRRAPRAHASKAKSDRLALLRAIACGPDLGLSLARVSPGSSRDRPDALPRHRRRGHELARSTTRQPCRHRRGRQLVSARARRPFPLNRVHLRDEQGRRRRGRDHDAGRQLADDELRIGRSTA